MEVTRLSKIHSHAADQFINRPVSKTAKGDATMSELVQVMMSVVSGLRASASRESRTRKGQAVGSRTDMLTRRADVYKHAGVEPSLDETLSDPVVRMMMQADRLDSKAVRIALRSSYAAADLRSTEPWPAPAQPFPVMPGAEVPHPPLRLLLGWPRGTGAQFGNRG